MSAPLGELRALSSHPARSSRPRDNSTAPATPVERQQGFRDSMTCSGSHI